MKISFAIPHSGCAYWRCRLPAKAIQEQGLAEVKVFDDTCMGDEELQDIIEWGDVIVRQSSMGIEEIAMIRHYKENLGKTMIGDYDDYTFSISAYNPSYRSFGLSNVRVIDNNTGREFWWYKDGKDGFDLKANKLRYMSLMDLLFHFDAITTTNKFLKEKYQEHNNNIFILPNSIDFNIFKPLPRLNDNRVRIGWTASDSHCSEIIMVKQIMRKVVNKYGDKVIFVELGNLFELQNEFNKNELELHPWVSLFSYPFKLASLGFDIGICPLELSDPKAVDFNRAKSQLKWSEFGALRIPSVCTNAEPYSCVEDGVTGYLASTVDEYAEKIGILVENADLRKKIGDNAYQKNYEDYNLEKNAVLWVEAYEQAREKAIDLPIMDEGMLEKCSTFEHGVR